MSQGNDWGWSAPTNGVQEGLHREDSGSCHLLHNCQRTCNPTSFLQGYHGLAMGLPLMFSTLKTLENHLSSKFSLPEADDRNGLGEQETLGKLSPCLAQAIQTSPEKHIALTAISGSTSCLWQPSFGVFLEPTWPAASISSPCFRAYHCASASQWKARPQPFWYGSQLVGNFPASSHECKRVAGHKIMLNFFFITYILLVLSLSPSAKIQ